MFTFIAHSKDKWAATRDVHQCGMCDQQRLRPACAFVQSDQSLCLSLEFSMTVKLLTEQHLEFLSLKGGCTDSSESTHVKMPHFWKSHVTAQWISHYLLFSCCSFHQYPGFIFLHKLIAQSGYTQYVSNWVSKPAIYTHISVPVADRVKRNECSV